MKHLYSFLLIILFLSFSCNRPKTTQEVLKKSDSLKISLDGRIVSRLGETLIPKAKKAISDWKEYRKVDKFILRYYNISNMEALQNARELSELVKQMKDSIKIEKLKQPSVIARLNVLNNEALRLADMATIPSISNEEVKNEVEKIVEIYSAVNSKINTIYKAAAIQKSLEVDTEIPIEIREKPIKKYKGYRNKIIPPKKTKQ
ncbi:hypothetical protein MNBD_BACTEROID04-1457 [hydrothermal vent metagenome]|uniref:Lipoprotein n=1 Tax=hydrothermal vent metagenome TaxID=652676 RepID=A0A3B0UFL3_9ZZZZ